MVAVAVLALVLLVLVLEVVLVVMIGQEVGTVGFGSRMLCTVLLRRLAIVVICFPGGHIVPCNGFERFCHSPSRVAYIRWRLSFFCFALFSGAFFLFGSATASVDPAPSSKNKNKREV